MNKQYLWGDATLLSASAAQLLRAPRFFSTTTTGSAADAATPRGYRSVAPLSRGSGIRFASLASSPCGLRRGMRPLPDKLQFTPHV